MQTLIQSKVKLKIASLNNSTFQVNEKSRNSKFGLNLEFYQKLFLILLTLCVFLIFPEFPKEAEVLCRKYHSEDACIIW